MKRINYITFFVLFGLMGLFGSANNAEAQGGVFIYQNWCQIGGQNVVLAGLPSTNVVQQSFPQCVVSVFLAGTTTPATIYSDNVGTHLANPFTANTDASFRFYAVGQVFYDVVLSGAGIPQPRTFPNVCLACGTGGGGGGNVLPTPQFRLFIQPNPGTQAVAGPSATNTNAVAPILQSLYSADLFNTGNNGYANAETAAGTGGFVLGSPLYPGTDTANFTNFNGSIVNTQTKGSNSFYYSNPLGGVAGDTNYAFSRSFVPSGRDDFEGGRVEMFCSGYGNNQGNGINGGCFPKRLIAWDYFKGIFGAAGVELHANQDNDSNYGYMLAYCGAWDYDPSREGPCEFFARHVNQYPSVYTDTIATYIDSTHFKGTAGNMAQYNGGFVLRTDNPLDSGKVTGVDNTGPIPTITTATTHATSPWGTTATAITLPADLVHGSPATVTVNLALGSAPTSGTNFACLAEADGSYWQPVTYTAAAASGSTQVITFNNLIHTYLAGSVVGFNDCFYIQATSAQQNPGFLFSDLVYQGITIPTTTSYGYWVLSGSYGFITINETPETLPLPLATQSATRDTSNNVTVVLNPIQGQPANQRAPGFPTLAMTGWADTSFNFGETPVTMTLDPDQITMHYVQPGGPGTSASTTGGTATISGMNLYKIYCGAYVVSITDPANVGTGGGPIDGYYETLPNKCFDTATVGTPMEQPAAVRINQDNFETSVIQNPGGAQLIHTEIGGVGETSNMGIHAFWWMKNSNLCTAYIGCGGTWSPGQALKIEGPFFQLASFSSPLNGGNLFLVQCENQCTTQQPFQVFNFSGFPGGGGLLQYTPSSSLLDWTGPMHLSKVDINPFSAANNTGCPDRLCIIGSGSGTGHSGVTIYGSPSDEVLTTYMTTTNSWGVGSYGGDGSYFINNSATTNSPFQITIDDKVHFPINATLDYLTAGPSQLCLDGTKTITTCAAAVHGTTTLIAGAGTISAPSITGSNLVFLQNCGGTSTAIGTLKVVSVTAGTGFTIQSVDATNTVVTGDTSNVCYSVQ